MFSRFILLIVDSRVVLLTAQQLFILFVLIDSEPFYVMESINEIADRWKDFIKWNI